MARIWVSPWSSRELSPLPPGSGAQLTVCGASDWFTTVKFSVALTEIFVGAKAYPSTILSVGFGTPQPLSPATDTRSRARPAAGAPFTTKVPASGNWMTWRSARSRTLVTIPASGVASRVWTLSDLFVTARKPPRWMVSLFGRNTYVGALPGEVLSTIATLVALVQSAPAGAERACVESAAPEPSGDEASGAEPACWLADDPAAGASAEGTSP